MKFSEKEPIPISKIESLLSYISSLYVFNTVFFLGVGVLVFYALHATAWQPDGMLSFCIASYLIGFLFKVFVHASSGAKTAKTPKEQELLFAGVNVVVTIFTLMALMRYESTVHTMILLHSFVPSLLWLLVYQIAVKKSDHDKRHVFYGFYGFLEWTLTIVVFAWSCQVVYQLLKLDVLSGLLSNLFVLTAPFIISKVRERHLSNLTSRIKDEIYTDVLTGLRNRRAFYDYYDSVRETVRSARLPGGSPTKFHLILIFADIDFFKKYNDHYGHDAGDECLKRVGQFLSENFNPIGLKVYRIGGEEFLLCGTISEGMLEQFSSNDVLKHWSEGKMLLPIQHHQSPFKRITLSGGLVSVEQEKIYSSNAVGITKLADELLYKSKTHRNTLSFSKSLSVFDLADEPGVVTNLGSDKSLVKLVDG